MSASKRKQLPAFNAEANQRSWQILDLRREVEIKDKLIKEHEKAIASMRKTIAELRKALQERKPRST